MSSSGDLPPPANTRPYDMRAIEQRNRRIGLIVVGIVVGMLGLTAASVPLYRLFCQITGFGGQAVMADAASGEVLDRTIEVRFNTDTNMNLPWDFKADQPPVTLKIGQEAAVSFSAINQGKQPFAGTAIYNVDPPLAGKYFHKTQCFCFDYQLLAPNASAHFPVVFYVDPAMDKDPQLKDLKVITLSYSFFKADSKELDSALEDFYNGKKSGTTSVDIQ